MRSGASLIIFKLAACILVISTYGYCQAPSLNAHANAIQDYQLGPMQIVLRIPGQRSIPAINIGSVDEAGKITFLWPKTLPDDVLSYTDQINYVLNTGNCDIDESNGGILTNKDAIHFVFNRIWLLDPETQMVRGQLMLTSSDSVMRWLHRPETTMPATGTYMQILYSTDSNHIVSTCSYETWLTPENGDEITLAHTSEIAVKANAGFQFVQYHVQEVHPYMDMAPKRQIVQSVTSASPQLVWRLLE